MKTVKCVLLIFLGAIVGVFFENKACPVRGYHLDYYWVTHSSAEVIKRNNELGLGCKEADLKQELLSRIQVALEDYELFESKGGSFAFELNGIKAKERSRKLDQNKATSN